MAIDPLNFANPTAGPVDGSAPTPPKVQASQENQPFGPAYVLDKGLAKDQVLDVPFGNGSAGQTMAALPPMSPVGMESLTRLSLQSMMQPRDKS